MRIGSEVQGSKVLGSGLKDQGARWRVQGRKLEG